MQNSYAEHTDCMHLRLAAFECAVYMVGTRPLYFFHTRVHGFYTHKCDCIGVLVAHNTLAVRWLYVRIDAQV